MANPHCCEIRVVERKPKDVSEVRLQKSPVFQCPYLEEPLNLATALVPSAMACFASSVGNTNRTAV